MPRTYSEQLGRMVDYTVMWSGRDSLLGDIQQGGDLSGSVYHQAPTKAGELPTHRELAGKGMADTPNWPDTHRRQRVQRRSYRPSTLTGQACACGRKLTASWVKKKYKRCPVCVRAGRAIRRQEAA